MAREVIAWVQPELVDLVKEVQGIDRVLALHDGSPEADFDVDIEVMELPYALGLSAAAAGHYVPYLTCCDDHPRVDDDMRVGLTWQAGKWDAQRSVSFAALSPLFVIEGVQFYSLQPGAHCSFYHLVDWSMAAIDVLSARMAALDLVISVDTMSAHLAGALGLPVWVLLHANCDWRWGRSGSRTPWYPTMRLYRQHSNGEWSGPVSELARDLRVMNRARTRKQMDSIIGRHTSLRS